MSASNGAIIDISQTLDHLIKEMQEGGFTDNEISLGTIRINLKNIQVVLKLKPTLINLSTNKETFKQ